MRVAILTVSDRGASGEYVDESGPLLMNMMLAAGAQIVGRALVRDERPEIEAVLRAWSDGGGVDLVLTTGGTGFGPRDVTPEATRAVIERDAPGLAELMRAEGIKRTAYASLSRQVCGIRARTLIVNLPGSPKAAAESLDAILHVLPHAVQMLAP